LIVDLSFCVFDSRNAKDGTARSAVDQQIANAKAEMAHVR